MTQDTSSKHYVILGGTSGVAVATARRLAAKGSRLTLVARNGAALQEVADDLKVRGAAAVSCVVKDLAAEQDQSAILNDIKSSAGDIDGVLIFYGILGDQERAESDMSHARDILHVNFTSVAEWVLAGSQILEEKGEGVLLAVSSVAGDRGRRSNFVYGAAKAGQSVLMQGLAHKWAAKSKKLRAVNMKLGFVDSPMTAHIEKGGPLWAQPDDVAKVIEKALEKGGPNVYAPWFWRWILLAIRVTPAFVFNKVNL